MSHSNEAPSAPPMEGPPTQPAPGQPYPIYPGAPPQAYPGQPGQPPQYPTSPVAQPYPGQPGMPAQPYPGQAVPGQPYPGVPPYAGYPPPGAPQVNQLYPTLPPPDFKDPSLNYTPTPLPYEPPPPYPGNNPPATVPSRPAPPIPSSHPMPPNQSYMAALPETPMPSGLNLVWSGCEGIKIFFIQPDNHVVAPQIQPIKIDFYALGTGSRKQNDIVAAIDIKRVWRLKLTNDSCYLVKSKYGDFAFLDHSTDPSTERVTVLRFPPNIKLDEKSKFDRYITQHSKVHVEDADVVTKITTGAGSIYNSLTQKVNTLVKETVPDAHKSTKAIRKGTGSVMRLGGNLLSKGIHLAADQIGGTGPDPNAKPAEEEVEKTVEYYMAKGISEEHSKILKSLQVFEKAEEANSVELIKVQ